MTIERGKSFFRIRYTHARQRLSVGNPVVQALSVEVLANGKIDYRAAVFKASPAIGFDFERIIELHETALTYWKTKMAIAASYER